MTIAQTIRVTSKRRPGPARQPSTLAQMDRLAAHVAEGGTNAEFTKAEGIYSVTTTRLWRMICADMGPQAI